MPALRLPLVDVQEAVDILLHGQNLTHLRLGLPVFLVGLLFFLQHHFVLRAQGFDGRELLVRAVAEIVKKLLGVLTRKSRRPIKGAPACGSIFSPV
jgi:hypothetical protein